MQTFDLIVIGSGSGLEVSSDAANRGQSVAVIESGLFGGTCLNRGCIPSKMLIHSADVAETIRRAGLFGIDAELRAIDWKFIIDRAANEVDGDARSIEQGNREHPNITVFKGTGRFVAHKRLEVDGEQLTAETVVIAAGTRPRVPDIDGIDAVTYLTSDEALRLPSQPRRLAIVGGGYIAAELAHFYGALGTEVTIVYRGPRLLRAEDDDIGAKFTEVYQRRFDLRLNTDVSSVRRAHESIAVQLSHRDGSGSGTIEADALLLATGRVPNSDELAVERTGVRVDEQGFIEADEYLETNVPGIWTLGDIAGRFQLKHSANLEAAYVGYNIQHPADKAAVDYHAMPHAIFASPQVGAVGLTEGEARARGLPYAVGVYEYANTAYGSSIEDKDGFVKVLVDPESEEILGCHILGTDASTLIQEVANAMRIRATARAITQSIYVHPALPEVVQRAFGAVEYPPDAHSEEAG
ncbi:MAG: mycothione reductase [Dehalococcoidia bacterium]